MAKLQLVENFPASIVSIEKGNPAVRCMDLFAEPIGMVQQRRRKQPEY